MVLDTLQPAGYGISTVFYVISTLTIALRVYSRGFIVKNVGLDDWFMFAILFFNSGQQAMLYYFLQNGGGLHIEALGLLPDAAQMAINLTNGLFAEEIYYVFMHWIIKMTFLLFYLRLAHTNTFKYTIWGTMGLNTMFTVIIWLIYCFQCIPLDAYFHPAAHPLTVCLPKQVLYYVPAALSIFTDLIIFFLPLQPLWTVKTTLRNRIMLVSVVSLGGAAVIVSMLRLIVLREFETSPDFTWALGKLIIISAIELDVAIMAANGPALKTIWSKHISKTAFTGSTDRYAASHELSGMSSSKRRTQRSSTKQSHQRGEDHFSQPRVPTEVRSASSGEISRNDSIEKLFKNEDGIVVTTSMGVESRLASDPDGHNRPYYQFDNSKNV